MTTQVARSFGTNDYYLSMLLFALMGYALLGRGFAYVGFPPLFVGEILLALGLLVLLNSGVLIATFSSLANVMLALLMAWTLVRTVPYVGKHGIDALRDAVVTIYGIYGFIIAGLLLEKPERLRRLIDLYGRFIYLFLLAILILFPLQVAFEDKFPVWPITGVPIVALKPGDIGVHLAGVSLFLLLGFRRFSTIWLILLLGGMAMAAALNRGGTLAILLPLAIALLMVRANSQLVKLGILAAAVVTLALILDIKFEFGDRRGLSARQIFTNLTSILTSAQTGDLDATKAWRLNWWEKIVNYTISGPYFWTGKGFGVNLATVDGFQVVEAGQGALLRSPHNATMTMLARGGVPALILWLLACASWSWTMLKCCWLARVRQDKTWSRFFLFIFGYWLAAMINATFDVALEGPMMGIWIWCLFGIGIAAAMIYRQEVIVRAGHDAPGQSIAGMSTGLRTSSTR